MGEHMLWRGEGTKGRNTLITAIKQAWENIKLSVFAPPVGKLDVRIVPSNNDFTA